MRDTDVEVEGSMPRTVNDKELSAVTPLTDPDRYSYLIKEVAGAESLWSLGDASGWVLMSDDQGRELVPIWPHERYAEACATGIWADAVPRRIELLKWMEDWLPGLVRDGRQVAAFPTPENKGVVVSSSRMRNDLEEELLNYG